MMQAVMILNQLENMEENVFFDENDSRQYLLMLQDVIKRMASNSTNCKVWMITIVTSMMAMMIAVPTLRVFLPISILPILSFYILDSYYLGLENDFRNLQKEYVDELKESLSIPIIIYSFDIHAVNRNNANFHKALKSKSTYPIYLALLIVVAACSLGVYFIKESAPQNLEKPLLEIVVKQDSIIQSINRFSDKYRPDPPVKVTSKTYNRSSFFRADNVDSVQVKVYGNEANRKY